MDDLIVVIDSSEVREGKLEEVQTALKELVEFVEANEAAPIAYNVYFSDDGTRMSVVQIHPNAASMEFHMKVAGPIFGKFADLLELSRVDFYGTPTAELLEQMRHKAQLLGSSHVIVNELHAGFTRFAPGVLVLPSHTHGATPSVAFCGKGDSER
jgi:quinol monooxygenase YgiN